MCGEKFGKWSTKGRITGSPPYVRGKEQQLTNAADQVRITPAYAGKRRCPRFRPGKIRDHPRTCGEKVVWSAPLYEQMGSPPHMRGKVLILDDVPGVVGITPAHAGKSLCRYGRRALARDHPRMCGEKSKLGT